MKQYILIFLLATVVLSGCGSSAYESFSKALERTNDINTGKSTMLLEMQFNGMEEKEESSFFHLEKLHIHHEWNKSADQKKSILFAKINNLGIDGTLFENQQQMILSSPLLPKLLIVENVQTFEEEQSSERDKEVSDLWKELITNDSVSRVGNVIVTTPDGDVKGKEFEVQLTSEQIKPLLIKTVELYYDQFFSKIDDIKLEHIIEFFNKSDIGPVSFYASIDHDFYIIEERLQTTFTIAENVTVDINFSIHRWDLGEEVTIVAPRLTPDNTMKVDELIEQYGLNKIGR